MSEIYGWLKSARENLCRAQTQLPAGDRDLVQGALDRIALIVEDGSGLAEIAHISEDADLYRKTDGVILRREDGDE